MIAPMKTIDTTKVACLRDSGPLGSNVSGLCSSKKLAVAQPNDVPYDAVNKFPKYTFFIKSFECHFGRKKTFSPQTDDKIWRLIGPLIPIALN